MNICIPDLKVFEQLLDTMGSEEILKILKKAFKKCFIVDASKEILPKKLKNKLASKSRLSEDVMDIYDITWSCFIDDTIIDYFDLYCKGIRCFTELFPDKELDLSMDVSSYLDAVVEGEVNPIIAWGSLAQETLRSYLIDNVTTDRLSRHLNEVVCIANYVLQAVDSFQPKKFKDCLDLYTRYFDVKQASVIQCKHNTK